MAHSNLRKGSYSQSGAVYQISIVTEDRVAHFSSLAYGRKVVMQLAKIQAEGRAETLSYVPMSDHLHWLMVLNDGELAKTMQLLKGRTAHAIDHAIWQENYHDHPLRDYEDLRSKARQIG